jgi:Tol biopolymer transport system component
VTRNPAFDADPTWSPDGRKLAFVSNRDGRNGVYVMNADGSGQQRLAQRSP